MSSLKVSDSNWDFDYKKLIEIIDKCNGDVMKNYSELSDFEINSAVHNATMTNPYKIEFLGNNKIRWIRGETDVITDMVTYGKTTLRDYCNNPSDAWPIILNNRISMVWDCAEDSSAEWWNAVAQFDECRIQYQSNPLRAAMIVYLMMKDNENA